MPFEPEGRLQRGPLAARGLTEWTLWRAARLGALLDLAALTRALQPGAALAAPAPAPAIAPRTPRAESRTPAVAPMSAPPLVVAPTPVPAPTPELAPPLAAAPAATASSFEGLLQALERRRPALAEAIRRHALEGEIGAEGVLVCLRELPARERAMLDDPAERAALAKLPGSPGPWEFRIASSTRAPDDLGQRLLESFGGREEEP